MEEESGELAVKGITADVPCDRYSDEGWLRTTVNVPDESELTISVNGQEIVTILCTATKLNCLVIGFLYNEGVISSLRDVASMRVCDEESLAEVRLNNVDFKLPALRKLSSGCGSGVTFLSEAKKVVSDLVVTPPEVLSLMKQLQDKMELYKLSGGIHTSALADNKNLVVVTEDIGRHNTLDKIQGECLLRGISARDRILLTTGRVSSEMILKAAKMQVPVVVSRTSPTGRSVSIARELDIALVGYARANRLTVYSHPERFGHQS